MSLLRSLDKQYYPISSTGPIIRQIPRGKRGGLMRATAIGLPFYSICGPRVVGVIFGPKLCGYSGSLRASDE